MRVAYEEADVVALDADATENVEILTALLYEATEAIHQHDLQLIALLDLQADASAVDAALDVAALLAVLGNGHRRQQQLFVGLNLDLGLVVTLDVLGSEILQTESDLQCAADAFEVARKREIVG